MKTQHIPEPWVLDDGMVLMEDQASFLVGNIGTDEEWISIGINDHDGFSEVVALAHPSNAERIVACVNACAGINPEAVPDLLSALQECVIALDMDDKFGDDIDARHSAEENAFYLASSAIKKATKPK